eukprot:gene18356-8301_t
MDNDRNQYAKLVDRTYDLTADAPHKLREKPEQSYSTVRNAYDRFKPRAGGYEEPSGRPLPTPPTPAEPLYHVAELFEEPTTTEAIYDFLQDRISREVPRTSVVLGKEIGSGQFGKVFAGTLRAGANEKTKTDTAVAIKMLAGVAADGSGPAYEVPSGNNNTGSSITLASSGGGGGSDEFLREATIMGQWEHPNIISLLGYVTETKPAMIVLELAEAACDELLTNQEETEDQLPPWQLAYGTYSTASDVWSYGVVLYEFWTEGHQPYDPTWSNPTVFEQISQGFRLQPPSTCPKRIAELMLECWDPRAKARPQFSDIEVQFRTWKPEDTATLIGKDAAYALQQKYANVDVVGLNASRSAGGGSGGGRKSNDSGVGGGGGFYSAVGSLTTSDASGGVSGGYETAIRTMGGGGGGGGGYEEPSSSGLELPYKLAETPKREDIYEMPAGGGAGAAPSPLHDPLRLQSEAYEGSPPTPPHRNPASRPASKIHPHQHPRIPNPMYVPAEEANATAATASSAAYAQPELSHATSQAMLSPATVNAATPSSQNIAIDGSIGEPLYRPIYEVTPATTAVTVKVTTAPTTRQPTSKLPAVPQLASSSHTRAHAHAHAPPPSNNFGEPNFRLFESTRKTNPLYQSMVGGGGPADALYASPNKSPQLKRRAAADLSANPLQLTPASKEGDGEAARAPVFEKARARLLDDRGASPLAAFSIAESGEGPAISRDSKRPAKNTAKWMADWQARQQQKPK